MSAPTRDYYSEMICILRIIHRLRKYPWISAQTMDPSIHGYRRSTDCAQQLHTPVPPFWEFVNSFPSDGATRVATTTNRPHTSTTDHAQSGMAPMNNTYTLYERFSSWTSHEVDEIECFIDKKTAVVVVRSSTCGAPLRTTELSFP